MTFDISYFTEYFSCVAGLLASLLGLVGLAYTYFSTEKRQQIDRLMGSLLSDLKEFCEKHQERLGNKNFSFNSFDPARVFINEEIKPTDSMLAPVLISILDLVEEEFREIRQITRSFKFFVCTCSIGLATSLIALIFSPLMTPLAKICLMGFTGLLACTGIVAIGILFFQITRQKYTHLL
jgi:hypothetical protein